MVLVVQNIDVVLSLRDMETHIFFDPRGYLMQDVVKSLLMAVDSKVMTIIHLLILIVLYSIGWLLMIGVTLVHLISIIKAQEVSIVLELSWFPLRHLLGFEEML